MKPGKHIFIVLLMIVGLLISSQPTVMAQEQLGAPVKTCQPYKDADCDLEINASMDHVPIPGTLSQDISPEKKSDVLSHLNSLHVPFIPNQGQVDKNVKFYAKTFGGTLFVTDKGEIVYSLSKVDRDVGEGQDRGRAKARSLSIKEKLIGAKVKGINGEGESATNVSYFKGNDPSKWKAGIPTHEFVSLGEVYKGIELKFKAYGNNVEKLFYVNPGADPGIIKLNLSGVKGMKVNEAGELELSTELGAVKFTKPVAYQERSSVLSLSQIPPFSKGGIGGISQGGLEGMGQGEREFVEVAYVVDGDNYGFKLGAYDKTMPVIIDPLLASTFIGGSDNDESFSIVLDSTGNVYVTGYSGSSNYPVAGTSYDSSYNYFDVFVSKLDPNLSTLLSSTFIGGDSIEYGQAIALDSMGNVYVTGQTESTNYPVVGSPYDGSFNGLTDVFVSKLDPNLSTLLVSTFIGGGNYDYGLGMVLDSTGNVYVTGGTWSSNYPTAGTPYDSTHNITNYEDVFVSKLDPNLSTLLASTFIGGIFYDQAWAIALDGTDNVYVTGYTTSSDYPTAGTPYDSIYNGSYDWNEDVFVSKLDQNLSTLIASTFIGGGSTERAEAIAIDATGNVYVTGYTSSSDYPTAGTPYDSNLGGVCDVFVSRLDPNLSTILSSTFIGGVSECEYAGAITLDATGNVYIAGGTWSTDFPAIGNPYDNSYNGSGDVFVSRLDPNLSTIYSSTFIGGGNWDFASAIALDDSGNVYVTGYTQSSDYPTAGTPYDSTFNAIGDVIISKLDANLSADSRLANISTRGPVQTGDSVMIGGFIISGTAPRSVLIRGFGPTLADWGVTGTMSNPYIELYSGQTMIATNDNWQTPITQCDAPAVSCGTPQDIQATGKDACTVATTGCSQDAAILVTLPPGAYTAVMRGVAGGTGVGLVGVDDNDTNTLSKLVNISTRGPVLTGDSVMIGGFIVGGSSSKTVLIRGFGPTLSDWGVTGAMSNPYVELYSGQTMIATNDNWQTPIAQCDAPAVSCGTPQDIQATGKDACSVATTGCSQDAAILVTLPPGAYTAIMRGVGGGTGVGLVGIDEIVP